MFLHNPAVQTNPVQEAENVLFVIRLSEELNTSVFDHFHAVL